MLRMQHFVKDGDPMKHDLLDEIESNKKKQRSEELHRDSEESLRRAREDEAARRSYEQRLRRQKLELMKLKQGQIEEDEIEQEKEPEKREYTFREKVSNFFYHYKFHVIAISVTVLFVGFLTVDYLRTVRPDIQAMFIADDYGMTYRCENITECWSSYTPDLNHDRKNVARLYYIPTNYTDTDAASMYMAQADRTKLIGEFQSGETIIIIGNKQAYDMLGVTVVIRHSNGLISCYSSLKDEPPVKTGDSVKDRQIIGFVGDTAISECAERSHLHFELHYEGSPIDPESIITFNKPKE